MHLQGDIERENSRSFDRNLVKSFSSKDAYECLTPKIRVPNHYDLKHVNTNPPAPCDPLTQRWIPPSDLLRHWQDLIRQRQKIAATNVFVESSLGIYNSETIDIAIRLHTAISLKKQVEREVDWFSRRYLVPHSVPNQPSKYTISRFKDLIWSNGPYSKPLEGLAKLCLNEHISCDHMMWAVETLNKMQADSYVIYVNYANCLQRIQMRFNNPMSARLSHLLF